MQFIVKTAPEELRRAQAWWQNLEMQWKFAYNEALFGKGLVLEPPTDDQLMLLLVRANTMRFAGPGSMHPNMTTVLTNLSGLIPLYHIRYLSITRMRLGGVGELARHTQMEHLFIHDNQIKTLNGIEGMRNLKSLHAHDNEIEDLTPLKNLTNLDTLYVLGNKLKNLDGITEKHSYKMKEFYALPNKDLPDREVIKFQNTVGIICRKG